MSTLKAHRTKFDPGYDPCVFLRYSPGKKGYKVHNLVVNKMVVSRHIQFYEKNFPYYLIHTTSSFISSLYPTKIFLPTVNETTVISKIPLPDILFPPTLQNPSNTFTSSPASSSIPPNSSSDCRSSPNYFSSTTILVSLSSPKPHKTQPSSNTNPNLLRKSTRPSRPPSYLDAYQCNYSHTDCCAPQHSCNHICFNHHPEVYKAFIDHPT